MKLTLRLLGLAGTLIFAVALALTFVSPIHYERAARNFIQHQIERQIVDRMGITPGDVRETRAGRALEMLADRHETEIAALRRHVSAGLNAQIAAVVARMQDLSCECRERLRQGLDLAIESRLSTLERAGPQLRRVIEGRYGEIVTDLLHDLRIFAATNLVAFLLLLVLSFVKPDRVRQLFVPGILLGAATVTASIVFIFGRNWFFVLLYGDFVGWGYGLWLILIYGLLIDIALFEARVTTGIASMLGKVSPSC